MRCLDLLVTRLPRNGNGVSLSVPSCSNCTLLSLLLIYILNSSFLQISLRSKTSVYSASFRKTCIMFWRIVQGWLRARLAPTAWRCAGDFDAGEDIPAWPPQSRIDFAGRKPLTRPSSPDMSSHSDSDSAHDLSPQPTPLLTILPPEIRCQIWKEALGGRSYHFIIRHNRLLSSWIYEDTEANPDDSQHWPWRSRPSDPHRGYQPRPPVSNEELLERQHVLALLLTC